MHIERLFFRLYFPQEDKGDNDFPCTLVFFFVRYSWYVEKLDKLILIYTLFSPKFYTSFGRTILKPTWMSLIWYLLMAYEPVRWYSFALVIANIYELFTIACSFYVNSFLITCNNLFIIRYSIIFHILWQLIYIFIMF